MSASGQALFFGKIPSRGDFVRSSAGSALIHGIDRWMSQTMELLADDARWKIVYDAASPVHFAVLGSQSNAGLIGHMAASQDASGRRFPFVMAASFEVPEPAGFVPYCPLALTPIWQRLDACARQAIQAEDFAEIQARLLAEPLQVEVRHERLVRAFQQFAEAQTIESFENVLSPPGAPVSLRQIVLALGLLLQPVLSQGHGGMNKGLLLPLARDPMHLTLSLTLWLSLVAHFFKRTPAEIALFVTLQQNEPVLVMGFSGASPATLRGVLDADVCRAENVILADAEWVEEWVESDYGLRKLSHQLRDPMLSLTAVIDMFRETFLGE